MRSLQPPLAGDRSWGLRSSMDHARFAPLIQWISAAGLSGRRELDLLQGFCERAVARGLPLGRAVFGLDTLHPILEGRVSLEDLASDVEQRRLEPQPLSARQERLEYLAASYL